MKKKIKLFFGMASAIMFIVSLSYEWQPVYTIIFLVATMVFAVWTASEDYKNRKKIKK